MPGPTNTEGRCAIAPIKDIEAALLAWRAAERRIEEANGNLTPEMEQQLRDAKAHYQDIATAHMTERIDALRAAEQRRAAAEPSSPPFHEAAAEEKSIASEIWSDADQVDRLARETSES